MIRTAINFTLVLAVLTSPLSADTSLSLAKAVEMALEHSLNVKTIRYDSAAAAFEYDASRALRFPTLTLEAKSYYLDNVPSFELPVPTIPAQRLEMGAQENYQADLTLIMPLYTGGRISRSINIAAEKSRAEISRLEAERMTVAYRCRRAYLNLLQAEASVDIAKSSVTRIEIINRDVNYLHDNGLADSVDILDAAQALETGRELLDRQQTGYANAEATLGWIIGVDAPVIPGEDIELPEKAIIPDGQPVIERAELKRLDHLINAADRAAEQARSDYYPNLNAFGGYSVGKPNRDVFNKEWDDYFRVGLSLNWKFEPGGKTARHVAAARQSAQSGRMARQALEDDLQLQYRISRNNLEQAFRAIKSAETEYDLARRKFSLAGDKQNQGQLSVNRLLELEDDLTGTELRYRIAIIAYYLAETDLLYAIGSPKIYGGLQ